MNYANHNLRTNLQEWRNRLSRASFEQFGHQLKFLVGNIEKNPQLYALLQDASAKWTFTEQQLEKSLESESDYPDEFENIEHQAVYNYQILKLIDRKYNGYSSVTKYLFWGNMPKDIPQLMEDFVTPIIDFLHEKLDKSNSITYLLEKYKKRTEWFTRTDLLTRYRAADKSYEQIFEDDLRMFLFDQGIEYPFSTPASMSGRADVVGQIETEDPLIVEIKIFDAGKGYGKNRIKDGFTQIVKYTNDYNKDTGYLVIFNLDEVEINFDFKNNSKVFPSSLFFNNKMFYFVVVNFVNSKSASNISILKTITVTQDELTQSII